MNNNIIDSLTNILNTYKSITAFFYKKIAQNKYTNVDLSKFNIDYNLLLPASEFIIFLNENQVNAQMQSYIDMCNILIDYIVKNVQTQNIIFYESIQNQLENSITQLNNFALSLLEARYESIYSYTVEYDMSFSQALYLNEINLDEYDQQATLNYDLKDFNNLIEGMIITLSR
jgi:hypothetical protein